MKHLLWFFTNSPEMNSPQYSHPATIHAPELCSFHGTFSCYAAVASVIVAHAFFTMPETKGKSLVNVERHFDKVATCVDDDAIGRDDGEDRRSMI